MFTYRPSRKVIAIVIVVIGLLVSTGVIVYFVAFNTSDVTSDDPKGAVVTNGHGCAEIGASILTKGGSAVDAVIAAMFCEGVMVPQCMGLGGGFLMTIYDKEKGVVETLTSREVAPAAATEDMFHGDGALSTKGGLAVAVPGELRGYWYAYKKYGGKVPWKDLVQPTIDLCRQGIAVSGFLAEVARDNFEMLYKDPGMREVFVNPETNKTYEENQKIRRLKLATTLEVIAEEGGDAIHNGSLTAQLAQDVQEAGGILTADDLRNYKPLWRDPVRVQLPFSQTLHSFPLPGSGVILGFIMNLLNGFLDYSQPKSITNWQRIVESFKYGYGRRTELGDMDFVDVDELVANLTSPEYAAEIRKGIFDDRTSQDPAYYGANTTQPDDHGTAQISVLAPNGDAVSVTTTINLDFGAGFMSPSTGIILNDEMDDFSSPSMSSSYNIPPSVANYIRPGKHPLSSMSPSIVTDADGEVVLLIGAAGGTKITTSVASVMVKNLWFDVPIEEAVADKRLHHQLFPMQLQFEETFKEDMEFVEALRAIGHEVAFTEVTGFTALTAISRKGGVLRASSDTRRPGSTAFVY